jgi:hypothetical protein
MRGSYAAVEHPGMCPFCGSEVEQYEESVTGIDRVCPVCLTDLWVPDPGPLFHPGRVSPRRYRARLRG